ncbi:MAG: hypothetical protein BJG00_000945 [Limnothrix sp. CACIAM 69d]|jgi:hypothetical protein|nr:MAG: hypothetical protein BJG00_000945 [Limnothrix sp. CACIAM 69d]
MKTDLDFSNPYLLDSVVFRPDFNSTGEAINLNQAWSLFFTAGREDKALGFNAETGRFFTNILFALAAAGALWGLLFSSTL